MFVLNFCSVGTVTRRFPGLALQCTCAKDFWRFLVDLSEPISLDVIFGCILMILVKNGGFPGFGSVNFGGWAQNCMRAQRFLAITGRRADEDVTEVARHLDFLKKTWISRFQFDPVHLGTPMRPALTDRPMRPRIAKNLLQSASVRWIARAGSVRHVQFGIFTQ